MKSAILRTKILMYYVFITFDRRNLKVAPLQSQHIPFNDVKKRSKTNRPNSSRFTTAKLSLIARFCSCIVCGQIPVMYYFQVSSQQEIWDREVRRPYGPRDTRYMKLIFVAQQQRDVIIHSVCKLYPQHPLHYPKHRRAKARSATCQSAPRYPVMQ